MVGCRIKMLRWEQDIFILTEAMQDSFEIGHVMYQYSEYSEYFSLPSDCRVA